METRKNLVEKLAEQENISKAKTSRIISGFFDAIKNMLITNSNERFIISGFGSFFSKLHKSRKARNLTTQQEIIIPERNVPHWKAAKEIRTSMNKVK